MPFYTNQFGLDIQAHYLSLLRLKKYRSKLRLEAFSRLSLKQPILVANKLIFNEEIGLALHTSTHCLPLQQNTKLVLTIPIHLVHLGELQLPNGMQTADIQQEILQAVKRHVPHSEETYAMDYASMRSVNHYDHVLYAVMRQSDLSTYQSILNKLNFVAQVAELEIFALYRSVQWAMQQQFKKQPELIVFFGAPKIILCWFDDKSLKTWREWEGGPGYEILSVFEEVIHFMKTFINQAIDVSLVGETDWVLRFNAALNVTPHPYTIFMPDILKLFLNCNELSSDKQKEMQTAWLSVGAALREVPAWSK